MSTLDFGYRKDGKIYICCFVCGNDGMFVDEEEYFEKIKPLTIPLCEECNIKQERKGK